MVIRPTSVVSPSALSPTCPRLMPMATKTMENSEICATVSPARKPVLFR